MKMESKIQDQLYRIEKLLDSIKPKPLTLKEASVYLDISKSYLYKLTSSGKVPFYRPWGKKIYFDKSELDRTIYRNAVKSDKQIEQEAENVVNKLNSRR